MVNEIKQGIELVAGSHVHVHNNGVLVRDTVSHTDQVLFTQLDVVD